jgi:aminotransferase
MATDVGVAVVPGPNFYANPADGEGLIRFAYPKKLETLQAAAQRMARLKG